MNADRNLLFGILAFQNNFIDRRALLAAFDQWTADKNKPLGDILVEMGHLDMRYRELLDGLVAAHLEQHDNDAEKSLAAVSPVGSVRADLERLADPDVEASLAHFQAANPADDPYATTPSAGTRSSSGLRFTILRAHAKGGLGQVSVALDEELNREVAFKEIQERHADDPISRSRFLLEAEVTGGLEHPGIVPVYGLGKYGNGRPFYAMRFVKGDSLHTAIKRFHEANQSKRDPGQRSLELRKLMGRLIDVCNAIEYAHSRRVLHRDLKPGNIMLGKYGETLVVDWGLAKPLGHRESSSETDEPTLRPASASGPGYTQMGSAIGTPQYTSPEQAAGRIDELGPATDGYSLGATLYCLLTGQPPFPDSDVLETAARVCKGDFASPRRVNPDVPAGLQAICLKAMALKQADRYASARAVADDIEHWLADEPVSARYDTLIERGARWTRRHRALARSAAAALLTVSVVSVVAVLVVDKARRDERTARGAAQRAADGERKQSQKAEAEKLRAQVAERKAEEAAELEKDQRIQAVRQARIANVLRLASESQSLRGTRPVQSTLLALEALRIADDRDTRSCTAARQAVRDALGSVGGQPLIGHSSAVTSLAISADGRWLASGSLDSTARLWDLAADDDANADSVVLRGHEAAVYSLAISPDGHWLATGSLDGTARLWDLTAEDPAAHSVVLRGHKESVRTLAISPDGHWLATGSDDHTARLWDLTASDPGENSVVLRGHEHQLLSTAISPDGHWLTTGSSDGTARSWNLSADDPAAGHKVLRGHVAHVLRLAISADGRWLATGGLDATARLWNLMAEDPGTDPVVLRGHKSPIQSLAISADGHWLATGADDTIRLWDLTAKNPGTCDLVLHAQVRVLCVAISPDSHWLVSGSSDHTSRLWDLTTKDPTASPIVLRGHDGYVGSLVFSRDGRWLATGSGDHSTRLWDLVANNLAVDASLVKFSPGMIPFAITPDGHWLASASDENTPARVWDLTAKDPGARSIVLRGREVRFPRITPDGHWLTAGSDENAACVWDLTTSDPDESPVVVRGHDEECLSAAISSDGRWLVTSGTDSSRLWDLTDMDPTQRTVVSLRRDKNSLFFGMVISPDSHWLSTRGDDGLRLWDLTAKDPAVNSFVLQHGNVVWEEAFSSDGHWYVTVTEDRTVRLWDMRVRHPAGHTVLLHAQPEFITSVAFSPDSQRLGIGSGNGTTRLWDLTAYDPAEGNIVLPGHDGSVSSLAISANGRWLATGGLDSTARLWDLNAELPAASSVVLHGHNSSVEALAIRPDGRSFVTVGLDGTARMWPLDDQELIHRANAAVSWLQEDEVNPDVEGVIGSYELAFRMEGAVPQVMNLSEESATTMAYGIGEKGTEQFGKQCLLARRFAEAGVRFIELGMGGWDQHKDLKNKLTSNAHAIDKPIAALLGDLNQRGLLKDTLVVWGGEFGRTPGAQGNDGRDHNAAGFSMWMAGGGVKRGHRYGATD